MPTSTSAISDNAGAACPRGPCAKQRSRRIKKVLGHFSCSCRSAGACSSDRRVSGWQSSRVSTSTTLIRAVPDANPEEKDDLLEMPSKTSRLNVTTVSSRIRHQEGSQLGGVVTCMASAGTTRPRRPPSRKASAPDTMNVPSICEFGGTHATLRITSNASPELVRSSAGT